MLAITIISINKTFYSYYLVLYYIYLPFTLDLTHSYMKLITTLMTNVEFPHHHRREHTIRQFAKQFIYTQDLVCLRLLVLIGRPIILQYNYCLFMRVIWISRQQLGSNNICLQSYSRIPSFITAENKPFASLLGN